MYSASVVDSTTSDCSLDCQEIAAASHDQHVAASRSPCVDRAGVISVAVCNEQRLGVEIGMPIDQAQVLGRLQVAKQVLDCVPVRVRRERQEATENRDGVHDVRTRAHREVEQRAHRRGVGHVCHELALNVQLRGIGLGETQASSHRRRDCAAVGHAETRKLVTNVLALVELDVPSSVVLANRDTQHERSWGQDRAA